MKPPWPPELDDPDPEVRARRTRLALETVIQRIRPGTLFYPVILGAYLVLVRDRPAEVVATAIVLAFQLCVAVVRTVLYRRTVAARAADPDRWRRIYACLSAAVMFVFEGFLVFQVCQRGLDSRTMILVVCALLMRAAGTYAASPDLSFHALWSRWPRIPMIIAPLVLLPGQDGILLAGGFALSLLYAEAQCRQLNAELWGRIVATDSLATAHAQLRHEVELRERAEVELRLAQKLESVGRLAAGIAHEINTPLQAIMSHLAFIGDGMTDLLEAARGSADHEFLAEKLPEAVNDAHASVARAAAIVRSMRSFSGATEKAQVDVNAIAASALTMANHECAAVADIVTDLGDLPCIAGYPGELNLVFLNLVVNAAQAIAATGVRGTLRIATRRDGDSITVSVADTGNGIADAIRDRIYDPFFTTKDVGKGTGQGLTIAHAVVTRRHGGDLSFTSVAGRGTTFTVRLPIRAPEAVARAA